MSIFSRIVGGAIAGAGTYVGLTILVPELGVPVVIGATAVMAGFGLAFGPKIWEVVISLF